VFSYERETYKRAAVFYTGGGLINDIRDTPPSVDDAAPDY